MTRKTTTAPRSIIERLRYSNPALSEHWKEVFSLKPAATAASASEAMVKPTRRTTHKPALRKPAPEVKPLAFVKKEPVVLQLRREDRPEDFERMAFVIRACSKDPGRSHLRVLHVERTRTGSRLVATDGLRLHVAEIALKLPGGDYKPLLAKDMASLCETTADIPFPKWRRAVPDKIWKRGVVNLEDSGWGKDRSQTERLSRAFNAFLRQTGELVNLRFLEDLTKKQWSIYCQSERGKAIVLKEEGASQDIFAVVMPLPQTAAGAQAA